MKKYLKASAVLCSLLFTALAFATTPSDASREPAMNTVSETSAVVPAAEAAKPDNTPGAGAGAWAGPANGYKRDGSAILGIIAVLVVLYMYYYYPKRKNKKGDKGPFSDL